MSVITMSRQVGSDAEEVAYRVAGELGLREFDKRAMTQVASEVGISPSEIVDYPIDEYRARNFFERLFSRQREVAEVTTWAGRWGVRSTRVLDEAAAIGLIEATMAAAYNHGDMLIIGRGGQAILEDKPDVLHVRVVAPLEYRVERLQAERDMTAAQARRFARERDAAAAEYLRTFHHIDWDDPTLYHLVVNVGKLGIDEAAALIVRAAKGVERAGT
ncbi:MAG: cytidylate kinase-like family protein [Chloroflexota bacterium]|nr:cytidylate kinase-like family protein [Chloroflexota bacterium]